MDRTAFEIGRLIWSRGVPGFALFALTFALLIPFAIKAQTTLLSGDPVTNAVRDNNIMAVRELVVRNASLNASDIEGRTPLILATISGQLAIVEILLKAGARFEHKDSFGNTALHWAGTNGDVEIAELLIHTGLLVNDQNKQGFTAMMLAAKGGFVDIVELFLESGGDATLTDYTGRDALGWARESRRRALIELLESATTG